jgi:hypothetical protein
MAARRLIALLVVVLVVASVSAALFAPTRPSGTPEGETTTSTGNHPPHPAPAGRLVEKTVQIRSKRPEVVPLRVGDQLELTVRTRAAAQVEVPRLGMVEDAAPDAPAHVSILTAEPGRFDVRLAEGRVVATLRVTQPGAGGRRGER